jgi:hypothetical protein
VSALKLARDIPEPRAWHWRSSGGNTRRVRRDIVDDAGENVMVSAVLEGAPGVSLTEPDAKLVKGSPHIAWALRTMLHAAQAGPGGTVDAVYLRDVAIPRAQNILRKYAP